MALSFWLKGATTELPDDGFDKLWRAFNALYSHIGRSEDNELNRHIYMRKFILQNIPLFTDSASLFSQFNADKIRKLRWRDMILNDYATQAKTRAFSDFILRYTDYRINQVFNEILPFRQNNLQVAGLLNNILLHISNRIANGEKNDCELLCLYGIKYSYFIRNKFFHGEKLHHSFYILQNDEIAEISLLSNIFTVFLRDLIAANCTY
ncbi:MAG: hypothetical protein M0Z41_06975 [Peptococcaceae bacterium]|nr:hypothetical protein [Peptococcaceae bacterium]